MAIRDVKLQEGKIYKNKGGGEFKCLTSLSHGAWLQNVKSGWFFQAHVVTKYEDGSIEWDYSTDGRFEGRGQE